MGEPQYSTLSPKSDDTEWDLLAKLVLLFGGTPASEDTAQALLAQLVALAAAGGGSSARLALDSANLSGTEDYQGITFTVLNDVDPIDFMVPVVVGTSGKALLASNTDNQAARGVAVNDSVVDEPVTILVLGLLLNQAANWTPGEPIYLGDGALTQTIPVASGEVVQQLGFALTTKIAFIDINSTYLVLE